MKYKIGFLDEDNQQRANFLNAFEDEFDIEIIDDFDVIQSVKELRNYINEAQFDALVVDFLLSNNGMLPYDGNEVVAEMAKNKKYFPVTILTGRESDAISMTEDVFVVNGKKLMQEPDALNTFKAKLSQAIVNYKKKIDSVEEETAMLEKKQKEKVLSLQEENRLAELHIELQAIDPEANPLPATLLQTDIVRQLSELVKTSREILNK